MLKVANLCVLSTLDFFLRLLFVDVFVCLTPPIICNVFAQMFPEKTMESCARNIVHKKIIEAFTCRTEHFPIGTNLCSKRRHYSLHSMLPVRVRLLQDVQLV